MLALLLLPFGLAAQAQVPRAPVLAGFGACVARQSPGVARALLATEPDSRDERRFAEQLFNGQAGCFRDRDSLSARVGEVRGIVAEALLETDHGALARVAARRAVPATRVNPQARGRGFVAAYSACLADADPAKALALLAADHHSQAEFDAFMAFGDTLNDCAPMTFAYRINRFDVRNHVAAHLYRVASAGGSAN